MAIPLKRFAESSPQSVGVEWKVAMEAWSTSREIVPITGAGLGVNFGLPDWFTLTERLCDALAALSGKDFPEIRSERDLLVKAFRCTHRLRALAIGDEAKVNELIGERLYHDLDVRPEGTNWLECVYQLGRLAGLHVTFNFDNLFETYSTLVHDTKAVISESTRALRRIEGQIDSLHVRGVVPHPRGKITDRTRIVFDSISYIEEYAEYMDRLSTALLYVMTNFRCIFLGLSMTDPNLLRLLRMARQFRNETSCWGSCLVPLFRSFETFLFPGGLPS